MRLVSRTDDDGVDARLVQHPVQRHLRNRDVALAGDRFEDIDDPVEPLVVDRAGSVELVQTADGGPDAAPELAGEQARVQRAPGHDAGSLVERKRHDLALDVTRDERVIDLLADVARQVVPLGGRNRLHHVPGGVVRAPDVSDFALPHQIVERPHRLLERDEHVRLVADVEIEVVGLQPAEAGFASFNDVFSRQAGVVRSRAHPHEHLGRQDERVPAALQGLSKDFLGAAEGVRIGGVDGRHAGVGQRIEDA